MIGYIAVADDMLFHDQTVTIGATLTVDKSKLRYAMATDTRFGSGQHEQRIWKAFHHADICDAYSTLYLYGGCFGESPIYRRHIFEVELGGNVVTHSQRNQMWSCDTITILREVTWDTVKVNKTNIESIISHRARTFDGPFTCEAICEVLADSWRMMAKLHPWMSPRTNTWARRSWESSLAMHRPHRSGSVHKYAMLSMMSFARVHT